ncbi:MAG: hypothetical protein PF961_21125 [Planctomycetota bacterium]|jgi:alpha-L-rhamnosidase|nr:hypothetical protein [Planctomycetota bacterium]
MTRIAAPAPAHVWADANIRPRYPIEIADWVCHQDAPAAGPVFQQLRCAFSLNQATRLTLMVSGDQRFVLRCDGQRVGMGPDRSDLGHWAFHCYQLDLPAGDHRLDVRLDHLGTFAPMAQLSWRPGFICACDQVPALNTGSGAWQAALIDGITMTSAPQGVFGAGPRFMLDHAQLSAPERWSPAVSVRGPVTHQLWGERTPGWRLEPSPLPEQLHRPIPHGRVRSVDSAQDGPFQEGPNPAWDAALAGTTPLTLPPNSQHRIVIDAEEYRCAFTELRCGGGAGASMDLSWCESLLDDPSNPHCKGQRDAVDGKYFSGHGHQYLCDSSPEQVFAPPWWSAGRFMLLTVTCGAEPVTITGLQLHETRLPIAADGACAGDDPAIPAIVAISERALAMCSHETYMDCPFYEQLMYVGDTRIQMLVHYLLDHDASLQRRGIDLFAWSRADTGYICERYPSHRWQLSCTFSLIWPLLVRDFALWRDDSALVRSWLPELRGLLDQFAAHANADGLLGPLPGWSFVDWVRSWPVGNPPGACDGISSIINLFYVLALEAAADCEAWYGDQTRHAPLLARAHQLRDTIRARFYKHQRGLYADDDSGTTWSEHAQCLAILCVCTPEDERRTLFTHMCAATNLERCTYYFTHYRHEAYARCGAGEMIQHELADWRALAEQGFTTTPENPEPSRSDCHAWGAHPRYHLVCSLLGLRPSAAGFARLELKPSPGSYQHLSATVPHPRGPLHAELTRDGDTANLAITSPVPIDLVGNAGSESYPAGSHRIAITLPQA